jgi:ribose transport system permease protein
VNGVPEKKNTGAGSLLARLRPFTGVIALVVLCAIFGSKERTFVSPENFYNILNAMAIIAILAVGQTFPLIGGGFDLSQGAIASFTGAVVASLMSKHGQPIPVAIAVGLATGALLGAVNGVLIAKVGINPFVATLGTQIAFFGVTNVYTDNQPMALGTQADTFRQLAYGHVGDFSYPSLLFLGLVVLLAIVLRLLPFGQYVYVLGGNEEAARLAGIPTDRIKILTYVLSGLLASVGGLVMIARAGQASPVAGVGYELQSLASCIVGGVALGGGVGSAWNVLLGALTLGVVDVGLQMAMDKPNWRPVIQGLIILLAVAVDARARARR